MIPNFKPEPKHMHEEENWLWLLVVGYITVLGLGMYYLANAAVQYLLNNCIKFTPPAM